jgi:hypothetical protein
MNKFTKWDKISQVWNELAETYFNFNKKYQKELFANYNIDCGTDYANYIFNIGDIKW